MRHTSLLLMLALVGSNVMAQTDIQPSLVSGTGRGGNEGPAMVCDGRTDTKWCIDSPRQMPYTITLDAGQKTDIAEYGFTTGDDTYTYPSRNPVSWRVSGSNDQQNWTLLDERRNDRSIGDENEQEYRFKPQQRGDYRYYRFEFLRLAGGTRIQLSEIALHKTIQQALPVAFVSGTGADAKEGAALVCDGRLSTKWCIDESQQMPYSIVLDAGRQVSIGEYGLATADDTHDYPDRNPVSWRVSGSNDRQAWTIIDERKNNLRLRDENEQEYRFKAAAKSAFRYYRFEFLKLSDGTRIQLSEIKLYGK